MPHDVATEGAPRLAHIPALDGLRGLAVLAVVAFHLDRLTGGYLGVDLFFVLSGYLITSLLIVERASTGTISLRTFYARRFRRLLPAVLVVLAAVGVVASTEVLPAARDELRVAGLATLAYVANWVEIASGAGYWDQTLVPSWLEHTWSLAIEEQFYVVWPLVVLAVGRGWRWSGGATDGPEPGDPVRVIRRIGRVAGVGALASGAAMIAWSWAGGDHQRLYLGTDTRAAALLLGCWAACRQQLDRQGGRVALAAFRRRVLTDAGTAAAAVLVVAWVALDGTSDLLYRGGLLACGVAATVVILDVTTAGPSRIRRALEVRPLRALGAISYGLYLWHWPVIQFLYIGRYGLEGLALDAVRVIVSLALAAASYVMVEQPIRQQRWPQVTPRLAPVAVAVCTLVFVVGTAGGYDLDQVDATAPRATSVGAPVRERRAAGAPKVPSVVMIGDSVAYSLAEDGLAVEAASLGVSVSNRAVIGCTLMRAVDDPRRDLMTNCSPTFRPVVADLRPDVVVLLFGGYVGEASAMVDGTEVWPCERDWNRAWAAELDTAIDVLSADGATVVLATAPTASMSAFKGKQPQRFDERQACANDVMRQVGDRRAEAVVFDLAALVCPEEGSCHDELDGSMLRPDGMHFHEDGARAIARRLGPFLVEVGNAG